MYKLCLNCRMYSCRYIYGCKCMSGCRSWLIISWHFLTRGTEEPTPRHKMPKCLVEQKFHFWTECHLNNFNLTTLILLVGLIYRWGSLSYLWQPFVKITPYQAIAPMAAMAAINGLIWCYFNATPIYK